jgi:threonine/homoserine/homoserine lactone efflux protein
MNYILLIVPGIVIGLIAAVPIGPVNLICIRRTLQSGSYYGLMAGLGAAMGDGLFASLPAFGFTALQQLIAGFSTPLQLIGGLLLLSFGIRTYFAAPPRFDERVVANGNGTASHVPVMSTTFVLTITNPATLVGFTALFAGLGGLAGADASFFAAAFVVLGVFMGSTLWWVTLTTVVGQLHARIDDRIVRKINEISGIVVALFGLVVLGHLVVHLIGR